MMADKRLDTKDSLVPHRIILKGRGHAKFISINFISIDSLKDVLYGVYIYFLKK